MKKTIASILFCLIVCATICLAGCSNEFAKNEYDDNRKIVQIEDRTVKVKSTYLHKDGNFTFTAASFDGRETLWKKNLKDNAETEIKIDLSVSSGFVKIVYIDCDNNVTVLVECSQDNPKQSATKTVSFKSGLNRLKIVGYDCKQIDLKMVFDEP